MIDFDKELVSALNSVLPTYYEMALTKDIETPCISYMEINNFDTSTGDTLGYSNIAYQVKIWGRSKAILNHYAGEVDKVLHTLGFKRISSGELYDNNSTMIQKIMTYEALALEDFK